MKEDISEIKHRVDKLSEEIVEIKKVLITLRPVDKKKSEKAWKDILRTSKEISKKWKGKGAVEEIREQRTK